MTKEFLKRFLPPVYTEFLLLFRALNHKKCSAIPLSTSKKKAIIIGNGPSLNDTVKKYIDILKKNDCFMVNHAIESDLFESVRPNYYVIADPFYFENGLCKKEVRNLARSFLNKIKWNMTIILPDYSKDSSFVKCISKNYFLNILYYNSSSVSDYRYISKRLLFNLWNRNMISPLAQTVLNTVTSLAITMRYENIYLVGADTTWTEMLKVDQKTNELYSLHKHFYENQIYPIAQYNENKSNFAEELGCIKTAFECYQILKEYALFNGCKLYNASEYSLIDCIQRKKLID